MINSRSISTEKSMSPLTSDTTWIFDAMKSWQSKFGIYISNCFLLSGEWISRISLSISGTWMWVFANI